MATVEAVQEDLQEARDKEQKQQALTDNNRGHSFIYQLAWHTVSFVLILLSLFFLRLELTNIMGLNWHDALDARFALGILRDAAALSGLGAVVWFIYTIMGLRQCLIWGVGTWFLFAAALANLCYFRNYGTPLELWAIAAHYAEAFSFFPSFSELQAAPLVVAAMVCLIVSTICSVIASYSQGSRSSFYLAQILPSIILVLFFSAVWLGGRRLPVIFSEQGETILTSEVVSSWYDQFFNRDVVETAEPDHVLATFRDLASEIQPLTNHAPWPNEPKIKSIGKSSDPLQRNIAGAEKFSQKIKEELGFIPENPLNVIMLYVSGWRQFELEMADTAVMVMPKTKALLDRYSISFTQVYGSALGAGQHEQAVFTVNCSLLANNMGPAAMMVNSAIKADCLPDFMRKQGYQTVWLGGFASSQHNLHSFELLHGTDNFYDFDYFRQLGLNALPGTMALPDGPMLESSLDLLVSLQQHNNRPFFAQITTSSANFPYTYSSERGELSPIILERAAATPNYLAYLSHLRYSDEAVAQFLEKFMASPLAENTVIVLLGNHGSSVSPYHPLTNYQLVELASRVPLAFIAKNIKTPARISWPVQQLDIAPTMAHLLGIEATANWLGQGLFAPQNTPWVQMKGGLASFRTVDKACYTSERDRRPHCYQLAGKDPLLTANLPEKELGEEEQQLLKEVGQLFRANAKLLQNNKYKR